MRSLARGNWRREATRGPVQWAPRLLPFLVVVTLLASSFALFGSSAPSLAASETVKFAAIGDYGYDGPNELAVADLVEAHGVDLIVTTGDNSYNPDAIDENVGKYYADYISPYSGSYGSGATTNGFFPTLGNHDYTDGGGFAAYSAYFSLPGTGISTSATSNPPYWYDFVQGPVHFFALDSNPASVGGSDARRFSTGAQGQWLKAQLAASTAPWKIVYFHHAPYSSGSPHGTIEDTQYGLDGHGSMKWPFEEWGATAVMNGHDHLYERILKDGNDDGVDLPYFVTGAGGRSLYGFSTPYEPGSASRHNSAYGSMIVTADDMHITFEYYSVATSGTGTLVDTYTIDAPAPPPDTTAPVITLLGDAVVQLEVGEPYSDAGATASDDFDGDITGDIVVVGDVIDTSSVGDHTVTYNVEDAAGNPAVEVTRTVNVVADPPSGDSYGLVDPGSGVWTITDVEGDSKSFYFGDPGDVPFLGDWDCDDVDTPGLYRQSDGYVYLRNSNTQGIADISYYFGNPGDVPLAGDFNGDGCDTVSIYRPSEARFYVINKLGSGDGGLGSADTSFLFGDSGDTPFAGDFDGDGLDTFGLYRTTSGLMYYRNSLTTGIADYQFYYGDPGDRFVSGDWNANGSSSPGVFRSSNKTMYLKYFNTQGNADRQVAWPDITAAALPVAGVVGDLP